MQIDDGKNLIKVGLIINPIAGLGGRLALKGSDIGNIRELANEAGISPLTAQRTKDALSKLLPLADKLHFYTAGGTMGADLLQEMGFSYELVHETESEMTSANDTVQSAKRIASLEPNIILFTGGDGTARDIYDAIGQSVPVLGIPGGVKIHSAVFATSPRDAGELLRTFFVDRSVRINMREVMDIDEEAFRNGIVTSRLYGSLNVPYKSEYVQRCKTGGVEPERVTLQGIAHRIIKDMDKDCLYLMGSGTSVQAVMDELELENTLLGVDVVKNGALIHRDANAAVLEKFVKTSPFKLVITIIGGQGFIFGRGNQQLSNEVLSNVRREDIIIVATKQKLFSLKGRPLRIDTGSQSLDENLAGYYKIIVGHDETVMYLAN